MRSSYQKTRRCLISVMDLYLARELSRFFLFSLGLLTGSGVAVGTVAELIHKIAEYQLPLSIASQIFGYKIPEYGAYALPISILLTCLVVYSRLNDDRELTALLSFGISFYRLILPALTFSLAITAITFILNELIVPAANYQANLLQTAFIPNSELNLQRQNVFFAEYEPDSVTTKRVKRIYFAEQYDHSWLRQVTILSFQSDRLERIITARSAQWNQQQQIWLLASGIIHNFATEQKKSTIEEFKAKQLALPPTIFKIIAQERSPEEMNIPQAQAYLNLIKDSGSAQELTKFKVRIQQKYAFPFICVVFSLVGSALGGKYGQLNRSTSFGFCVAIVFTYYFLGFVIGSLGITGLLSPFLAGWLPNIVALTIGIYLVNSANK